MKVGTEVVFRVMGNGDQYSGRVVSVHYESPVMVDGVAEEVLPCELPVLLVDVPNTQSAPGVWCVPSGWLID